MMKIGIPRSFSDVLPLSINLALYLEANGEEVSFIDPEPRAEWLLKQYGLRSIFSKPWERTDVVLPEEVRSRLNDLKCAVKQAGKPGTDPSKINFDCRYLSRRALLEQEGLDHLILWNGLFSLEKTAAQELGIAAVFLENGYFPNTLQIDRAGVNSQAEFAKLKYEEMLSYKPPVRVDEAISPEIEPVSTHPVQCLRNAGLLAPDC